MEFVENVTTVIDQKFNSIALFVDLGNVFDTIEPCLLLQKYEYYSLQGKTNQWLRSYLDCQVQSVTINTVDSN